MTLFTETIIANYEITSQIGKRVNWFEELEQKAPMD